MASILRLSHLQHEEYGMKLTHRLTIATVLSATLDRPDRGPRHGRDLTITSPRAPAPPATSPPRAAPTDRRRDPRHDILAPPPPDPRRTSPLNADAPSTRSPPARTTAPRRSRPPLNTETYKGSGHVRSQPLDRRFHAELVSRGGHEEQAAAGTTITVDRLTTWLRDESSSASLRPARASNAFMQSWGSA